MKEYNKIISSVRDLARDELRLEAVNRLRTRILDEEISMKTAEDGKANSQKGINICKFIINKIDPQDPRKEEVAKENEEKIKFFEGDIKAWDETIASHKKDIGELNNKIAEIESGKALISKERLSEIAENLIAVLVSERVKELDA